MNVDAHINLHGGFNTSFCYKGNEFEHSLGNFIIDEQHCGFHLGTAWHIDLYGTSHAPRQTSCVLLSGMWRMYSPMALTEHRVTVQITRAIRQSLQHSCPLSMDLTLSETQTALAHKKSRHPPSSLQGKTNEPRHGLLTSERFC